MPVVTIEKIGDATEGGANGAFRFTRTGDLSSSLPVKYTVGGTATPGTDYTALTGTVTFPANAATVDVNVVPIDDTAAEYDEDVEIDITNETGYIVGSADAAGLIIVDNETPVASVARLYDALEDGWAGAFVFRRTGDTGNGLTVNYTVGGSATSGTDFTALTGTVTFAPGQAVAFVEVEALADVAADSNETVSVTIQTGTGYNIHPSEDAASLVITESAPSVWIDSSPATVAEGTSSEIVIKRTGGDLSQELSVEVFVGAGSGSGPQWSYDYYVEGRLSLWSGWGRVTFAANQDTVILTLYAREDNESEGNEAFLIELGEGDGTSYALATVSSVTGVITDVVPSGTVPALADNDKPLSSAQATQLGRHLQRAAGNGQPLSGPEKAELEQWMKRLAKYGLEAEGEQRLQQLQSLLEKMGKVVKKPGAVGNALDLYSDSVSSIISGVKVAKENEYKKFAEQMGGLTGAKAKEKYDEISAGFRPEWVQSYWVRYQAEKLKEAIDSMKNP